MAIAHRKLHFDSMQAAMAEAEALASSDVTTTGSYSFGQIAEHLARTLDVVTGTREAPKVPWIIKLFGRLVRKSIINKPPRPGFKLPKSAQSILWPEQAVTPEQGMKHLRQAFQKFMSIKEFPRHPFFGDMTFEENHKLQCRHFELHLGFVNSDKAAR